MTTHTRYKFHGGCDPGRTRTRFASSLSILAHHYAIVALLEQWGHTGTCIQTEIIR